MKTQWNLSRRRLAALLVLVPLVCVVTACERQASEPEPTSGSFTLPDVDVSTLPEGLQQQVQMLRTTAQQSPEAPQSVGILGAAYYVHGRPEAAVACFARAKELAPQTMYWWYYLALAHDHLKEREKAIAAYERALELDSNYGPVYVRLADLLVESDRERATRLCQRALELNPDDSTALCTLGACAEAAGDQTTALKRYEEALEISPTYKEAHEALASILSGLNREEEAERHRAAAALGTTVLVDDRLFEQLLRNGFHLQTLLRDAAQLAQRGLFEEADRALATASEVDPTGTVAHAATGMVRAMQSRFEEAAEEFRLVLEAEPDRVDIRTRLADVQVQLGKYPEAEAGYRAALETSPDDLYALERYSQLLLILGRGAEAETLLRAAAEHQPTSASIRFQLGVVLFSVGQDDAARQEFEAGLEISPDDPHALYYLGLLAQRAGDLPGAKKHWERAIEANPKFAEPYAVLAEAALQEHDFAAAERYLRDGSRRWPEHPGLANGLAWILATSANESQRNGQEAVALAEKACELTQRGAHQYLDTLAAAYAEAGRFDDAVKTAREAIEQLTEAGAAEEVIATYQQRLELYEKKQPYRDVE